MTSQIEANEIGVELAEQVIAAITDWQQNAPRTQQSSQRILGMSEMGACREYIRATIAGDPKGPQGLKWAAYIGTALGDHIEGVLGEMGFQTQQTVTLTLPRTGVKVTGHLDLMGPNLIGDLKSVNGLDAVRRDGPSFKNKAQIAGYVIAALQAGILDEDGTGHLIYYDRSGADDSIYTWSVTVEGAWKILDAVEERLLDVQHALATSSRNGRDSRLMTDEPESWCYAVQCPFYSGCWAGYTPTDKIEHPDEIERVQKFVKARAEEKEARGVRAAYKEALKGIEGVTPDGTIVRWTAVATESGRTSERLDVREPKES